MKYTNIFDKVQCLFDLISSSIVYIVFLVIMLLLTIVMVKKVIKRNKTIILMLISYLGLFVLVIANNSKELSKVFDSISTNLFTNIYFPSTYAYLFIMLVIDIVTVTTFLNKKSKNSYKIADGICFFSTKFILALIMEVIAMNKIDVFNKKSLFGNKNLVVLLETSMNIFIIWGLAIVIIYITEKIGERIMTREEETKPVENITKDLNILEVYDDEKVVDDYLDDNSVVTEYDNDAVSLIEDSSFNEESDNLIDNYIDEQDTSSLLEISVEDDKLPNPQLDILNKIEDTNENINNIDVKDNEIGINNTLSSDELFNKLLTNGLPLIKEEAAIKEVSSVAKEVVKSEDVNRQPVLEKVDNGPKANYTLNDYRIFNKILKDIQRTNNSNIINIDRSLEIRLLMKYTEEEYSLFKGMLKSYSN